MRKILIPLAAAASAIAVATPASAQWGAPPPPPPYGNAYGYGSAAPYGNAYGYQNHYGYQNPYGQVRALQARIDQLQRTINRLDRRDVIREREANRLRETSRNIERRLHRSARYGLNPREAYDMQRRIANLEQRIALVLRDGHRWSRNDRRWNDYWSDRDRDGRNDRWEDDRGRRSDRR